MSQTLYQQVATRILQSAVESSVGIQVIIEATPGTMTPTYRAKQILLRFKRENIAFQLLQIKLCPHDPDHRLWLIKTDYVADSDEE